MRVEIRYVNGMPKKMLFGSIALILLCGWCTFVGVVMLLHRGPSVRAFGFIAAGIAGIIFFGYALMAWWKRSSGGMALLATDDGIVVGQSRSLFVRLGMISWEEIKRIFLFGLGKQRFLAIEMFDDSRLRAGASTFEKLLFSINDKFGYPQIQIPQNAVECDLGRVTGLLEDHRSRLSKGRTQSAPIAE